MGIFLVSSEKHSFLFAIGPSLQFTPPVAHLANRSDKAKLFRYTLNEMDHS